MTLEEAKKEIKKQIDKYNNDMYKYDALHIIEKIENMR